MPVQPHIGEIMKVGFNFAPRGWSTCSGQLLPISQHQALFSLIGTTYGGDGRTTFALPDLRGRAVVGIGNGPGLTPRAWGQKAGQESISRVPPHSHPFTLLASADEAESSDPTGNRLGSDVTSYVSGGANKAMAAQTTGNSTGGPVNVMNPFLSIYECIAMVGVFPSRN